MTVRVEETGFRVLTPGSALSGDELWGQAGEDSDGYSDAIEALGLDRVVTFLWDDGPVSSSASIEVFETGGRSYVSVPPDLDVDQEWLVPAAVEPAGSGAGFGAFLVDLLSDNGEGYGLELFAGLPTRIELHRPDLLEPAALDEALAGWGRWAAAAWGEEPPGGGGEGWTARYLDRVLVTR